MIEFKQAVVSRSGVFAIDRSNTLWFRVGTGRKRGSIIEQLLDRTGNYWQRLDPKLRTIGVLDWRRGAWPENAGYLYGYDEAGNFYMAYSVDYYYNGEIHITWEKYV